MKTNAMSKKAKLTLFIIGLSAFLYGASAFAGVRCGNELIQVGDPEYKVMQACGTPVDYHRVGGGAQGGAGDEAYVYFKIGNETVKIHLIDGHVYTIGGDENRN
jgi:hypothetical protein